MIERRENSRSLNSTINDGRTARTPLQGKVVGSALEGSVELDSTSLSQQKSQYWKEIQDLKLKCQRLEESKKAAVQLAAVQTSSNLAAYNRIAKELEEQRSTAHTWQKEAIGARNTADLILQKLSDTETVLAKEREANSFRISQISDQNQQNLLIRDELIDQLRNDLAQVNADFKKYQEHTETTLRAQSIESADFADSARLRQECAALRRVIHSKDEELARFKTRLISTQDDSEKQIKCHKSENLKLHLECEKSKIEFERAHEFTIQLRKTLNAREKAMNQMVEEADKVSLERELADRQAQESFERLRSEYNRRENDLTSTISCSLAEHQKAMSSLNAELVSARRHLESTNEDLLEARESNHNLEERLTRETLATEELRREFASDEHKIKAEYESRIKALQSLLEGIKSEQATADEKHAQRESGFVMLISRKDADIASFMEVARKAQEEAVKLSIRLKDEQEESERRLIEKERGFDRMVAEVSRLERVIELERGNTLSALQTVDQAVRDGEGRFALVMKTVNDLRGELDSSREQLESLYMQESDQRSKVINGVNILQNHWSMEKQKLQAELNQAGKDISRLSKGLQASEDACDSLVIEMRHDKEELERARLKAEVECEKLRRMLISMQTERSASLDFQKAQAESHAREKAATNAESNLLKAEIERLGSELLARQDLEYSVVKRDAEIDKLKTENAGITMNLKQTELKLKEVKQETADLLFAKEFAYKKLLGTVGELQAHLDILENDKRAHRDDISKLIAEKNREAQLMKSKMDEDVFAIKREVAGEVDSVKQELIIAKRQVESYKRSSEQSEKALETAESNLNISNQQLTQAHAEVVRRNEALVSELRLQRRRADTAEEKVEFVMKSLEDSQDLFRHREAESESQINDMRLEIKRILSDPSATVFGKGLIDRVIDLETELRVKVEGFDLLVKENAKLQETLERLGVQ